VGDLDVLWQPIQLGSIEVPNRVFVSAHETYYAPNRALTDRYVTYLSERARGGAGLVIIGASAVHPRGGANGHMEAWRPENVAMYGQLADRVHGHGGKVFVQLFHCGHQGSGQVGYDWEPPQAPSAIQGPVYDRQVEPMGRDDIDTVIGAFGECAALAQEGGLDGVELSGGHGYLIGEFISPMSNRRDDDYGGSVENRCRLAIEIATEIRRRCGDDYPLGIRVSYDEYLGAAGIEPDGADEVLRVLHAAGLFDYFSVSGCNYHSVHYLIATMTSGLKGHMAGNAERARRIVGGDVPIMTAAGVREIEHAAQIVADGQADMIAMTRAHIADPEIVSKARSGRSGEIRHCVAANQGCVRRGGMGKGITCTVNAAVGREDKWGLDQPAPAEPKGHVVVVGGGPAGLKAAESSALRGHRVTLLEREPSLGGALLQAAALPGRDEWMKLIDDLAGSVARLGVDVRLGSAADPEVVTGLSPDAVVVATGATYDRTGFSTMRPDRAGIPGAQLDHVADPAGAVRDPDQCGGNVLIVDEHGDHGALSLAIMLAESGRTVTVVTHQLFAGGQIATTADLPWVYPRLVAAGVTLAPQSFVEEIRAGSATVADMWGRASHEVDADTVIMNLGRSPEMALYEALADYGDAVVRIGDCLVPREVDDAIYEGERTGRTIAGMMRPAAERAIRR
jgi:2,4-dienoyl-CoA reductase-like NADH-dependent reductase (Old Yellow Enzyme family)/thioredoxin reductase